VKAHKTAYSIFNAKCTIANIPLKHYSINTQNTPHSGNIQELNKLLNMLENTATPISCAKCPYALT
jgi:hypothetical protein